MEDFQTKYKEYQLQRQNEELEQNAKLIQSFIEECHKLNIPLEQSNFSYVETIGIVATYPNIVALLHPQIIVNDEGLCDFLLLNENFQKSFFGGYLIGGKCIVMAHPFFRRGYHQDSNFAPRFVELFWRINNKNIDASIALDPDRVRINLDNCFYIERDTWYGPKFNDEIRLIKDGLVKLAPPIEASRFELSFLFADMYALDLSWKTVGNIKTFEAEEFKTEEVITKRNGIVVHPVRYVHAEFDIANGHFRHFDGAIHFYSEEEYYLRRDSDLNYNQKNGAHIKASSEKLFRFDGVISTTMWIEFVSHFLAANPLVFEYFTGDYPEEIRDMWDAIRKNKAK